MTVEQGKNNLPESNTPEFAKWVSRHIDALGSRTETLRQKLRDAGLLNFGDTSINPNAPHMEWEYRKVVPYKRTSDSYNATFNDTSTKLSIRYDNLTETFTLSRPAGKPRNFHYVQYRSGDTFQFSPGGFGGGYVPEEIFRILVDESGHIGFGYSSSQYDDSKYIKEAFGDANRMVDKIDASISSPKPSQLVAEHAAPIQEKDCLRKRLSRFFTKS